MDLISVVVPVYNSEKYLNRCVSSIIGQTYQDLQVILVDDGSTDQSPELCNEWAKQDSRVTVIHQSNAGVSAARNIGLRAATGTFILQVDSDDYIAPQTVETLMNAANKTGADMVICNFIQGSTHNYWFPEQNHKYQETIDKHEALNRIYIDSHHALQYVAPWCKLCKHTIYDGIYYPDGKIFEDIYTTHKLLYKCEKIAVVKDQLFYYFQRPESIMNTAFSLKKLDYLQALVERVDFFTLHNLSDLEQIAYDELLHALIWEYSRTRDVLHSKDGMAYVHALFKQVYQKGYTSSRYPKENTRFLTVFNRNPEWIVQYWRCSSLLHRVFKRNG